MLKTLCVKKAANLNFKRRCHKISFKIFLFFHWLNLKTDIAHFGNFRNTRYHEQSYFLDILENLEKINILMFWAFWKSQILHVLEFWNSLVSCILGISTVWCWNQMQKHVKMLYILVSR
jgi:hypothetical protein